MTEDQSIAAGDETVIPVSGELDFHSAPFLRRQILAALNDGARRVVLDVSAVEFIDSSGLSVIVSGLKRLRERGGDLVLRSPTDRTRKVLEVSGLNRILLTD